MQQINYPNRKDWKSLIQRPNKNSKELTEVVSEVMRTVKRNGDAALRNYTQLFDGINLDSFVVTSEEINKAKDLVSKELKEAIQLAKIGIETFHRNQLTKEDRIETYTGVSCWREQRAIEKVGLYIPGGTAPLFSSLLMLGIPAKLAGCKEIILCTPAQKDNSVNPAILFTASLLGIETIYKVGGAQAIAAMTFGTDSIPQVYKLFGPGNQYVTKAKEMAQLEGVAIDMPAGPSEVLVIADDKANPAFVASDLLSQAEHGADSQVILVSTNAEVINSVLSEIDLQLNALPRKVMAKDALANSQAILLETIDECLAFSNAYGPEHLILNFENCEQVLGTIENAGSVFLGQWSCESFGDYASGTNHTLPTNGYARNYSGVSIDSFVKKITFQKIEKKGVLSIGKTVEIMAEAEGLQAHKNAVSLRLKALEDEKY